MKKRTQNLLLLIASIGITFIILEFLVRILGVENSLKQAKYINFHNSLITAPHPFYPDQKSELTATKLYRYRPHAQWSTEYPSNERGTFDKNNRITYQMNSHGFRDKEFKNKKTGTFRIVTIGDSFTLGEGVNKDATFVSLLNNRLNSRNIEIYNLGISG